MFASSFKMRFAKMFESKEENFQKSLKRGQHIFFWRHGEVCRETKYQKSKLENGSQKINTGIGMVI